MSHLRVVDVAVADATGASSFLAQVSLVLGTATRRARDVATDVVTDRCPPQHDTETVTVVAGNAGYVVCNTVYHRKIRLNTSNLTANSHRPTSTRRDATVELSRVGRCELVFTPSGKLKFHGTDTDTDTDILADLSVRHARFLVRILAKLSVIGMRACTHVRVYCTR